MYARRSAELDYMNREIEVFNIDKREKKYLKLSMKDLRSSLSEKLMKYAEMPNARKINIKS